MEETRNVSTKVSFILQLCVRMKSKPKALDSRVALASVMVGKYGLMRSSIVTVAKELKAEEMVLRRGTEMMGEKLLRAVKLK